jgi:hypothetical protein
MQGLEKWLKGPVNWLPRTSSRPEIKEGIDKDLADDWKTKKGKLKN